MRPALLLTALALAACSGAPNGNPTDGGAADLGGQAVDDPQLPPEGATAVNAWLAKGYYTSWHCEAAPHDGRTPSPHGMNRICENDALATFTGAGEFPVGAAAVKELYESGAITGYSLYVKTAAGGCDSYYYFERFGSGGASTDKVGSRTCTGCHGQAAPPNGHDCVYTIVQ